MQDLNHTEIDQINGAAGSAQPTHPTTGTPPFNPGRPISLPDLPMLM